MQGMRLLSMMIGLMLCAAPLAGALSEQEAYEQIAGGLREEVQILTGISDATSAAAAVEPLGQVLSKLAALNGEIGEKELWRYIDNTPDLKQPLIEEIELLFVQLQRLEKAKCYHCAALSKLLGKAFNPAADKKR